MQDSGALTFGQWFTDRRIKAGFKTKAQFVRDVGIVSASAIGQVEAGKLSVALDTAMSLGRAVGASDLETLAAMGELQNVTPSDVQLLEQIARLGERDRRVVAELVAVLLREKE